MYETILSTFCFIFFGGINEKSLYLKDIENGNYKYHEQVMEEIYPPES